MNYKIGIVGATGAVGQELIKLLENSALPCKELLALVSECSAKTPFTFQNTKITPQVTQTSSFNELDIVFFCANNEASRTFIPKAKEQGCLIIDNSSAFRQDPSVPLIIPEINGSKLNQSSKLIANPNCSTAIALMGLFPLHQQFKLKRFIASTYQAVSGSGIAGLEELHTQTKAWMHDQIPIPTFYPYPIAFNLIPHIDILSNNGYTKEESKMEEESRKILNLPQLRVSTTCVRVPVMRTHAISVSAEFENPVNLEIAQEALRNFPGLIYHDTKSSDPYPMPFTYSEKKSCGIGRLRKDTAFDNGLSFWIVGDQLWKGAALNAIQIAETLHKHQYISK